MGHSQSLMSLLSFPQGADGALDVTRTLICSATIILFMVIAGQGWAQIIFLNI